MREQGLIGFNDTPAEIRAVEKQLSQEMRSKQRDERAARHAALLEQRTKNDTTADPKGVLMFGAVPFAILVLIAVLASGGWSTFAFWGAVIVGGATLIAAVSDIAAKGRHQVRVQVDGRGSPGVLNG